MICIVNYGIGNFRSLERVLSKIGVRYQITDQTADFGRASHIILPGVGRFETAMRTIREKNLDKSIIKYAQNGTPILGVCLGLHILSEFSEEGMIEGLGLLKGKVVKKNPIDKDKFKVPNVGWVPIKVDKRSLLLSDLYFKKNYLYFSNLYGMKAKNKKFVSSIYKFDDDYVASMEMDNIFGTQFHPEKSGEIGVKLIKRFLEIKK